MVFPGGFEPPFPAPKAGMIDHYTTGILINKRKNARGGIRTHELLKTRS